MLNFIKKFGIFCFLDNHEYEFNKSYECIAGAGVLHSVISNGIDNLRDVDKIQGKAADWVFGHVAYDVKNEIEQLRSSNPDGIGFPDFFFFVPEIVFILTENELKMGVHNSIDPQRIYNDIISLEPKKNVRYPSPLVKARFTKKEYIETVQKLQQ